MSRRIRQRSAIRQAVLRASGGTQGWFEEMTIELSADRVAEIVTTSCSASVWYIVVSP